MGLNLELDPQPTLPGMPATPALDTASAWTRKVNWMRQNMCSSAQWDHKDNLIAVALLPQALPNHLTSDSKYGRGGIKGGEGDRRDHDPNSVHDSSNDQDPSLSDKYTRSDLGEGGVGGEPGKTKTPPNKKPPGSGPGRIKGGKNKPNPYPPLQHPVWDYWLTKWNFHKKAGRPPLLDKKRLALIVARLNDGFDQQTLCLAIDGIWASQWHRQADQIRFDLCLRDAAHIERFAAEGLKLNGSAGPGNHAPFPPMPKNVPIDPGELLPLSEIVKLASGPAADDELVPMLTPVPSPAAPQPSVSPTEEVVAKDPQ